MYSETQKELSNSKSSLWQFYSSLHIALQLNFHSKARSLCSVSKLIPESLGWIFIENFLRSVNSPHRRSHAQKKFQFHYDFYFTLFNLARQMLFQYQYNMCVHAVSVKNCLRAKAPLEKEALQPNWLPTTTKRRGCSHKLHNESYTVWVCAVQRRAQKESLSRSWVRALNYFIMIQEAIRPQLNDHHLY
jgi:hypothetical protein